MRHNQESYLAEHERTHDDRHKGDGSDLFTWGGSPRSRRSHSNSDRRGWRSNENDHEMRRPHTHSRASRHGSEGVDPRFGPDAYRDGMPRNETERLIASRKVEGTPVYDREGKRLGSICTLMINKRSGQTEYAILKNSGGFLGLDERYYPLDWRELEYDTRVHGYGVDFSENELDERDGYDFAGRRLSRGRNRGREPGQSDWW